MLRFAASRPTQATGDRRRDVELAVPLRRARRARLDQRGRRRVARRLRAARAARPPRRPRQPATAPSRASDPCSDAAAPRGASTPPPRSSTPASAAQRWPTRSRWPRPHGVEAHGIWTVAEQEQAWATDDGGGAEARTDAFMKVICIAPNGRSGYASQSAAGRRAVARALAERAALKADFRRRARRAACRARTRWYSSRRRWAGCSTCSGRRPSTASHMPRAAGRSPGGSASAWQPRRRSTCPTRRASPRTLPRCVRRRGQAEGAAAADPGRRGPPRGARHSQRGAGRHGQSTGHALRPGGDAERRRTRPTSCSPAAARADEAELCAPIERGIYVTRLWYANVVRPKETLITGGHPRRHLPDRGRRDHPPARATCA